MYFHVVWSLGEYVNFNMHICFQVGTWAPIVAPLDSYNRKVLEDYIDKEFIWFNGFQQEACCLVKPKPLNVQHNIYNA